MLILDMEIFLKSGQKIEGPVILVLSEKLGQNHAQSVNFPWKLPRSNLGSEMRSLDQIFSLSDAVPDTRGLLISDHATTAGAESSKCHTPDNS